MNKKPKNLKKIDETLVEIFNKKIFPWSANW